jgi:hypothetical protein
VQYSGISLFEPVKQQAFVPVLRLVYDLLIRRTWFADAWQTLTSSRRGSSDALQHILQGEDVAHEYLPWVTLINKCYQ